MFNILVMFLTINTFSSILPLSKIDNLTQDYLTKIRLQPRNKKFKILKEYHFKLNNLKNKITDSNYTKKLDELRYLSHLISNIEEINEKFTIEKCEYKKKWIIAYYSPKIPDPPFEVLPKYSKVTLNFLKELCP